MALDMTPMTELDAVNVMLASIGQAPVNTLSVTGIRDVEIARTTLHNQLRSVLAIGWHFNTDEKYPIAADVNGKIGVPANVLSIDAHRSWIADVSPRVDPADDVRRIYDREHHTFVLTDNHSAPFEFDVTWLFAFDEIPQTARNYIGLRAARQFQAHGIGSDILYRFTMQDELEARAELDGDELRRADYNVLSNGSPQDQIWKRRIVTR